MVLALFEEGFNKLKSAVMLNGIGVVVVFNYEIRQFGGGYYG